MKISVIVTVLNEANSISLLLDSLLEQSLAANEIVIVDGGSTDFTTQIIEEYAMLHKKIKLIRHKSGMAEGRNEAIRKAANPIIAQTDGGCIADKDWLKKITAPFGDKDVGLVAGFYRMTGDSNFQKAIAPFHGVCMRRFDQRVFMPSGRSMAFRKSVWEEVGGYSETVDNAGEDAMFNYKVMKAGIKMVREPDALVDWELPRNIKESCKKIYYYTKGDAKEMIWWHPASGVATHSMAVMTIILRYLLFSIFFLAGLTEPIFMYLLVIVVNFYLFWMLSKLDDVVYDFRAKLWLPIIQVASDICMILGFVSGFLTPR